MGRGTLSVMWITVWDHPKLAELLQNEKGVVMNAWVEPWLSCGRGL